MTSLNNKPMSRERLAEIRAMVERGVDVRALEWSLEPTLTDMESGLAQLLAEVEWLHSREAEWDSKEQALQKSIAEHERVIAKLEARYDEQGTYNHQLVRRLTDALEIARAVAESPIEIATFRKVKMRVLCLRSDVRRVQEQARALLAGESRTAVRFCVASDGERIDATQTREE